LTIDYPRNGPYKDSTQGSFALGARRGDAGRDRANLYDNLAAQNAARSVLKAVLENVWRAPLAAAVFAQINPENRDFHDLFPPNQLSEDTMPSATVEGRAIP
jgi:hypothetical protein